MQFAEQSFVSALNHVLARSPWALQRLQPFAGFAFRVDATPIRLDAAIAENGLLAAKAQADTAPEVILSLSFSEIPGLLVQDGMDKLISRVRIEGNVEFAETLGFVFRHLDWDIEEDLSTVFGDILARRIVTAGRELNAVHQRGLEAVQGNVAEYLTEESELIASRVALETWREEIVDLRDGVARLEKRIERLGRQG